MNLWGIVDKFEGAPPSNVDPKVQKEYQKRMKKAMFIIALNLVDKWFAHIRSCKGPADAWQILCNIHEMRSLLNILSIHCKFFMCKMDKGDDLLDHINKIKALANQLACLQVLMKNEDVIMNLLKSL